MKLFYRIALIFLISTFSTSSQAGFDEGMAAFENGDSSTAFRELLPAAKAGNVGAQELIGVMYKEGIGVGKNSPEALKWLTKAADQGRPVSQFALGTMYGEGNGVKANQTLAIDLITKSAEQGYIEAQKLLGASYAAGKIMDTEFEIKRDFIAAEKWLIRAAKQKDKGALNLLIATFILEEQLATTQEEKLSVRSKKNAVLGLLSEQ